MRNLTVSKKLIVSFMIIVTMIVSMGIFNASNMLRIDSEYSDTFETMAVPMPYMAKILSYMQEMRVCAREFVLGVITEDDARIDKAYQIVEKNLTESKELFDDYYATITSKKADVLFLEARSLYENNYSEFLQNAYLLAKEGRVDELNKEIIAIVPTIDTIIENLEISLAVKSETGVNTSARLNRHANNLVMLIIIVLVCVTAVSVFLAFYVSGLISKPLAPLSAFMKKAGATGDLTLEARDIEIFKRCSRNKDEIGETIKSATAFIQNITDTAKKLEQIADGDLRIEVNTLSDADTIGNSMKNMLDSLNIMFGEINASTAEVTSGSKHVADGAQTLAQGAAEQTVSINELSNTIFEIAERTKESSEIAKTTANLSKTIKDNAENGSRQMNEMIIAVGDINEASMNIGEIMKSIDEIAFQTNILALNATVEAAHAGRFGRGFAVVAEEVRNLANKSALAAKESEEIIRNSIEKAELGSRIAGETASEFQIIVSGINKSSSLIAEIAEATEQQAINIEHINTGIEQVAQVIQRNSSTAEESAAASEEISSQSDILQQLVTRFKLKNIDSAERRRLLHANVPAQKRLTIKGMDEYAPAGFRGE